MKLTLLWNGKENAYKDLEVELALKLLKCSHASQALSSMNRVAFDVAPRGHRVGAEALQVGSGPGWRGRPPEARRAPGPLSAGARSPAARRSLLQLYH